MGQTCASCCQESVVEAVHAGKTCPLFSPTSTAPSAGGAAVTEQTLHSEGDWQESGPQCEQEPTPEKLKLPPLRDVSLRVDAAMGLSSDVPLDCKAVAASEVEAQARALLHRLRAREAAALLQQREGDETPSSNALRDALQLQLQSLGDALESLAHHPGLRPTDPMQEAAQTASVTATASDDPADVSDEFFGVHVPLSPSSARSRSSVNMSPAASVKPDILEIAFDLDDQGHRVEAVVEFKLDGTASIQWTAMELPVPLSHVLCLVQEIDLIGDLIPYVQSAAMLHQFPWNQADQLVRVISKPPIPFVPGLEAISQRFGFDLLDTPWAGFCLVECGPSWTKSSGSSDNWRGVPKPPTFQAGLKQVEVKTIVALGRPSGKQGELTTILFSGKGDLKVPRKLLPNWLVTWLVKAIGRFVYQHTLDCVAKFDATEHGKRLHGSRGTFYSDMNQRIRQFAEAMSASGSTKTC